MHVVFIRGTASRPVYDSRYAPPEGVDLEHLTYTGPRALLLIEGLFEPGFAGDVPACVAQAVKVKRPDYFE
jgi:hypothetical protein